MKESEGYKYVRYNGRSSGTIQYKGSVTNTVYRFSTSASHRIKLVFEQDVEALLHLMDGAVRLFEVLERLGSQGNGTPSPEMVATGAPIREEVASVAQATPEMSPAIAVMPTSGDSGSPKDGQKLTRLPENPQEAEAVAQAHVDSTLNPTPEPEVPDVLDGNVAQVQAAVGDMSIEEIGTTLAREKAGKNRAGAKKALTDAMMEKVNA